MAQREWFRSPDWGTDAAADFEARLARARSHSRPQYLRIKALALEAAGEGMVAEELLRRVIEEYPDSLDAAFSAERLGDRRQARGDFAAAEAEYRRSMDLRTDLNGTSGEVHLGLAEALNAQGRHQEALQALEYIPVAQLGMAHAVCRWNVALADAALGVGERTVAEQAAARALALLDAPDQFARHPGIGRATLSDDQQTRLRLIANGRGPKGPRRSGLFRRK